MSHQKASSRIRPSLAWVLAPAVLIAAAASCDRQAPPGLDDTGLDPGFKGKPGGDPITVDDFNPKEGDQGQRFVMAISGSGFGNGAKVIFALNGDDVSTISTTTTSVDETGTSLTADVDIGLDAVVSEDYRVAVSLRGSRGVGTEDLKFRVKLRANELLYAPLEISLTDGAEYRVRSDDLMDGVYRDGENPDVNVNAYVSTGQMHADPGRVDIHRLSYSTGRVFRMGPGIVSDPPVLPTDPGFADALLDVCGNNPCELTEKIILDGRDSATDALGNVLEEGILSLSPGQTGTTRLILLWFVEDSRGRTIGKNLLRYGQDCSNPIGAFADDVPENRVSVTAVDSDGDGSRDYWIVEGSKAYLCRWDGKVKGKYVDRGHGEFDAPIEMRITQIGDLVPTGPGGS